MPKKQPKKNNDRTNPKTDTEYVDITLNIRKEDQSAVLNSYLGLVVSNFEKGVVLHVNELSQAILADSGPMALAHLSHYKENLLETLDSLSILERDIKEIMVSESSTVASRSISFKKGKAYTNDELNEELSKSAEELSEGRATIKKKKATKKASKKK